VIDPLLDGLNIVELASLADRYAGLVNVWWDLLEGDEWHYQRGVNTAYDTYDTGTVVMYE
jgi:hypothetical protein